MDPTVRPGKGWNCEFAVLPATPGSKMRRAQEVVVLPATATRAKPEQIEAVQSPGGLTEIFLRTKRRDIVLDRFVIR